MKKFFFAICFLLAACTPSGKEISPFKGSDNQCYKTVKIHNMGPVTMQVPCTPEIEKWLQNHRAQSVSNAERLKILKEYGFYYYEPLAGICFRAVLFYQAVSETQVECTKRVQGLLINKDAYPNKAEEGAR